MTKDFDKSIDTTLISHEIVAKFAMAEELRLVSSKMDRLYKEISNKIPLDEEYLANFRHLKSATQQLEKYQKSLKRTAKCQKKESTKCENQKKTSTGSTSQPKNNSTFLKKLKSYWYDVLRHQGID